MCIAIQNTLFFRRVYDFAPCSNILCSVMVCIRGVATMVTTKVFPFSFANMQALRTHLRSVGWRNGKQLYPIKFSLVRQELPKLVKTPSVQFLSLCLAFCLCCFTDIAQIFNSNPFVFCFCFFYYPFRYGVVIYGNKSALFSTKPFQQVTTATSAFGLNAGSYFRIFFTDFFKLFRIIICTIRQCANIYLPKVTTNKFFHILYRVFTYVYCLKQIKFTLSVKQIRLPFDAGKMVRCMAGKWHFQPAINRPDRNNIVRLVGQDATVISNASKRLESTFYFSIQFVSVCYFADTPNENLCRQVGRSFKRMVDLLMKLKLVKHLFVPCYLRNSIATGVCFFNGFKKQTSLLFGRQEFNCQRKFHSANSLQIFEITKNGIVAQFLPPVKNRWEPLLLII